MRPYLVFVRAGPASLHLEWLAQDPGRSWDLCVNAWGEPPVAPPRVAPEWCERGGLNKLLGFQAIYPGLLAALPHRYLLLLDDDLRFAPGAISRFFAQCERARPNLCQPAIRLGSHANHVLNLRNPACRVRRVSFVEVMAPCFDRATLSLLLPSFSLTQCTWGIDWAWASILAERGGRLAVVDAVGMHHTKPMDISGGPFYEHLRALGIDPAQELAAAHERYPIREPMHTLAHGHRYRWPLPGALNAALLAQLERRKLQWHLRLGGTLAQQTAPVQPPRATLPLKRGAPTQAG